MDINSKSIIKNSNITVKFFYENTRDRFGLKLISEEVGFEREILDQNLHRPGLALAGFVELFSSKRVQLFGNTEMRFIEQLDDNKKLHSLERLFKFDIPCLVISNGNSPTKEMLHLSEKYKIPIFMTDAPTTKTIYLLSDFLDDQFAPRLSMHGSFVDVYGVGMLFVGKSGVGKSEVALDLVERGHRLVADDVVIITKKGEGILMGAGTDLVKHFMEVRGIGIIDVRSMFGVRAIRFQKRLEVVIDLEIWDMDTEYTRTGLDDSTQDIMGIKIPYVKLPIVPGKNITVISEIIALNYLLKHYGYDAPKVFRDKLSAKIKEKNRTTKRTIDYFEHDFE
ncbi:MAG: HPr kinase/phosphorylase [Ignavibacteriae bacterium]|nr:HPr kinase/phosphorylase [Ignavibacteriota bacterium]NOG96573.1 HPr kinase/phosphorylase [Ignavibacteriota bacterium]